MLLVHLHFTCSLSHEGRYGVSHCGVRSVLRKFLRFGSISNFRYRCLTCTTVAYKTQVYSHSPEAEVWG